jgi:hypothetical protein
MTTSLPSEDLRRPKADLLDAILIVFVSAAIVIFLLWSSSRFLDQENFERLPNFITDTYSAIWALGITGGAGLGGAIIKHIFEKNKNGLDYLRLVFFTVSIILFLLICLVGLALFVKSIPSTRPVAPPNASVINFSVRDREVPLRLSSPLALPVRLSVDGSFTVQSSSVTFKVQSWSLVIEASAGPPPPPPFQPTHLALALCRVGHSDPNTPPVFPPAASPQNSFQISFTGQTISEAALDRILIVPMPPDSRSSSFFPCAYLFGQSGPSIIAF